MDDNTYALIPEQPAQTFIKRWQHPLIIGAVAAALLGAVAYEIILPAVHGKSYLRDVQAASQSLQASLDKVAESTTRPIFTSTGTDNQSNRNDIVILKEVVQDAEVKLASFNATAGHLMKFPISGYVGSYRQARGKQKQANSASEEVKKRLDAYKEFVTYLDNSNQAGTKADKEVNALNAIGTMTDAAEVSRTLREAAAALRTALDATDYPVPEGFEASHLTSITLISTLARQCDDLANAVDRGDESQIGTIYLAMQATNTAIKTAHNDFQSLIGQDSEFIRNTKALPTLVADLAHD